jgi:ABC-type nitrate/sulfonate/bicarbonate transport system permease component
MARSTVGFSRTPPSKRYTIAFQAAIVIVFLAAWYVLTATKVVTSDQIPSLGGAVGAIGQILSQSEYLHDITVTAYELLLAFLIAGVSGLGLGFILGEYGRRHIRVRKFIETGMGTALATPKFIFLPILVLLVGAGYWEKVVYAAADGLIVTILSTSAAAYTVGENERLLARSYNMSPWQLFTKIFGPSALMPVLEALRISMVLVISGVLLAEMYISNAGMGFLIFQAGSEYNIPLLVGAMFVVAAMAVILNSAFRLVEESVGKWRA